MEKEKKDSVKRNVVTGAAMAGGVAAGVGIGATVFAQEANAETPSVEEPVNPDNNQGTVKPPVTGNHHNGNNSGNGDTPGEGDNNTPGEGDNNTPGEGDNNTPGEGDNNTPGEGDNNTPGEGDNNTPGESDNNTPGESDNNTPGEGDNNTPGEGDSNSPGDGDNNTPGEEHVGEVEVISYSHEVDESGNEMDVAVVSVDGEEISFIDHDLDGQADVMAYDENGDGQVASTEHFDVEDMDIEMQPFQDVAYEDPMLAMSDSADPCDMPGEYSNDDYINDADINSFMA